MDPIVIYTIVVGLLYVLGIVSVAITIPRVARHWKPVYWLGLATVVTMTATYTAGYLRDVLGFTFPERLIRDLLLTALALVALLFVLVPFVHRYEAKMLGPTSTGVGEEE